MQRQKKGDKVIIKRGGKKRLETGDSGSSPSYSTDVCFWVNHLVFPNMFF